MTKKIATIQIKRSGGSLGEAKWVEYKVPLEDHMTVLGVLDYIYENLDSGLAHYKSCRFGRCKGCYVVINGSKPVLACEEEATEEMRIEPMGKVKVIRDLVVDMKSKG